jgi:hypothetical protein
MHRMLFGCFAALAAAAVGCGGKTGPLGLEDEGQHQATPPLAVATDDPTTPVYFGLTNTVFVDKKTVASMELVAASEVELMVVTKDGSPLRYDLYKVWKDGMRELISPIDRRSGFHVTTFVPKLGGRWEIEFPEPKEAHSIVVHLECRKGRCAEQRQPGEECDPAFPCAPGLACVATPGGATPLGPIGTCGSRAISVPR